MRQNGPLKRGSYVRNLPFMAVRHLAMELDADGFWERMIPFIPKTLSPDSPFVPRYTAQHVSMFARENNRSNGSPTRAILNDWGTQNCTIDQLINVLEQAELVQAANYLKEQVLHETVDDEEDEDDERQLPIPAVLLPPAICDSDAVPGNQPHRVMAAVIPEPQIDFLPDQRGTRQPVQNDLSLTPPSSLRTVEPPSFGHRTLDHRGDFNSFGAKEMLAECAPNLDSFVRVEKLQGKAVEKTLDRELLEPVGATPLPGPQSPPTSHMAPPLNDLTPPPARCLGGAIKSVVQNTGELQHMLYDDLFEITDGFSEVKYSEGGRLIGTGGFGMVHLGIDRDGKRLAVKVLKKNTDPVKKQFQVEVKTLSEHRHRNLVSLLGYSCDGPKSCIVFEYLSNGSLEDRLLCLGGTPPLPARLRIDICKGSARGIEYLNSCKIVHRDIKSANILLDEDFTPKLGDFATARLGPSGSGDTKAQTTTVIGTSAYLAPEAHHFDVSTKLDSYSFGVVMLELLTGLPAFDTTREDKDLASHMLENYDDIIPVLDHKAGEWVEVTARQLYTIACRCLETSKKKRVLVSQVLPEIENL